MPRLQEKLPSVDMIEREDQLIVRAEMPGVNKDDIEVSINGNMLTIQATPGARKPRKKGNITAGRFTKAKSRAA